MLKIHKKRIFIFALLMGFTVFLPAQVEKKDAIVQKKEITFSQQLVGLAVKVKNIVWSRPIKIACIVGGVFLGVGKVWRWVGFGPGMNVSFLPEELRPVNHRALHQSLDHNYEREYLIFGNYCERYRGFDIEDVSVEQLEPILRYMHNGPAEDHPHYQLYQDFRVEYGDNMRALLNQHGIFIWDLSALFLRYCFEGDRRQRGFQREEEQQVADQAADDAFQEKHGRHNEFNDFIRDKAKLEAAIRRGDQREELYRGLALKYDPARHEGDPFYVEAAAILGFINDKAELEAAVRRNDKEYIKVYRRLALKYHPDKNPGDLFYAEAFVILTQIKEGRDNVRRGARAYDRAPEQQRQPPRDDVEQKRFAEEQNSDDEGEDDKSELDVDKVVQDSWFDAGREAERQRILEEAEAERRRRQQVQEAQIMYPVVIARRSVL